MSEFAWLAIWILAWPLGAAGILLLVFTRGAGRRNASLSLLRAMAWGASIGVIFGLLLGTLLGLFVLTTVPSILIGLLVGALVHFLRIRDQTTAF
jgi:hypothetical protein